MMVSHEIEFDCANGFRSLSRIRLLDMVATSLGCPHIVIAFAPFVSHCVMGRCAVGLKLMASKEDDVLLRTMRWRLMLLLRQLPLIMRSER